MPCNSDYLNPNQSEVNSREAASHIVYLYPKIDEETKKAVSEKIEELNPELRFSLARKPLWITQAANDYYGAPSKLDLLVQILCAICTEIEARGQDDAIIYNGRDPEARRLADWWDEHKAADVKNGRREA